MPKNAVQAQKMTIGSEILNLELTRVLGHYLIRRL